jgi:hypothetical protein
MSYQWSQDRGDRPDGLIVGATNATYLTPGLRTNTTFWVSVTNSAGSVLSDRATITVVPIAPRLNLQLSSGLPVLTLEGAVGLPYRVESSPEVSATNWTVLAEFTMASNPFTFVDAEGATAAARFYRAVVP